MKDRSHIQTIPISIIDEAPLSTGNACKRAHCCVFDLNVFPRHWVELATPCNW